MIPKLQHLIVEPNGSESNRKVMFQLVDKTMRDGVATSSANSSKTPFPTEDHVDMLLLSNVGSKSVELGSNRLDKFVLQGSLETMLTTGKRRKVLTCQKPVGILQRGQNASTFCMLDLVPPHFDTYRVIVCKNNPEFRSR